MAVRCSLSGTGPRSTVADLSLAAAAWKNDRNLAACLESGTMLWKVSTAWSMVLSSVPSSMIMACVVIVSSVERSERKRVSKR